MITLQATDRLQRGDVIEVDGSTFDIDVALEGLTVLDARREFISDVLNELPPVFLRPEIKTS